MKIEEAFPKPLRGEYVGKGQWKLIAPFVYRNTTVPVDFIIDGASIPKIAWSIIGSPWSGKYALATVPHDYGYHTLSKPREEIDKDFIEGMRILGVSLWKRRIMYRMVRMFAWICWKKRKRELKNSDSSTTK